MAEGPEDGHRFRFTVQTAGSYAIWDEETGTKSPHFDAEFFEELKPWTLEVRAWNLRDALTKAAALPLNAWDMGEEV